MRVQGFLRVSDIVHSEPGELIRVLLLLAYVNAFCDGSAAVHAGAVVWCWKIRSTLRSTQIVWQLSEQEQAATKQPTAYRTRSALRQCWLTTHQAPQTKPQSRHGALTGRQLLHRDRVATSRQQGMGPAQVRLVRNSRQAARVEEQSM